MQPAEMGELVLTPEWDTPQSLPVIGNIGKASQSTIGTVIL